MKRGTASVLLTIAASVFAAAAHATTYMESLERASNGQTTVTKMWIDADRYRSESGTDGKQLTIFTKGVLYFVNTDENTYMVMSKEALAKHAKAYNDVMKTAQAPTPKPIRKVQDTGRWIVVGPSLPPCRIWHVFENNELKQELCNVPLKTVRTGAELLSTMRLYNALLGEFGESTPNLPWTDVETTMGFPLRMVVFADGKPHHTTVTFFFKTDSPFNEQRYMLPLFSHEREESKL